MGARWNMKIRSSEFKNHELKFVLAVLIIYVANAVYYFSSDIFELSPIDDGTNRPKNRIQENLAEINLTKVIADGKSAIKSLSSNASLIAETAEKVIESALQPLLNKSQNISPKESATSNICEK